MAKREKPGIASRIIKTLSTLDRQNRYSGLHIELSGQHEAAVDGLYGVLEYDDEKIRLNTGKSEVVFCGKNLNIDVFDLGRAVIRGEIESIRFCG